MKKSIKAIETRYKGYRFRSRLEARYAIFFDQMGMDWEYEPEGFDLPVYGKYLPDFFIKYPAGSEHREKWPDSGYWVEIKGSTPTEVEAKKLLELENETGHIGWLFYDGIGESCRASTANTFVREEIFNSDPAEGFFGLIPGAADLIRSGKNVIRSKDAGELWVSAPVTMCSTVDEIDGFYPALSFARSARFEHGETP